MSAAEIIEQIKALPREEQRQVFSFVRSAEAEPVEPKVQYMDMATFRAAKERVFEKHSELFRRLAQ
jgi:hypothetical protein